jgi:hypothetical protein
MCAEIDADPGDDRGTAKLGEPENGESVTITPFGHESEGEWFQGRVLSAGHGAVEGVDGDGPDMEPFGHDSSGEWFSGADQMPCGMPPLCRSEILTFLRASRC